jgi:outer membrane protein OmpA-like peptidoglycan-associated protein
VVPAVAAAFEPPAGEYAGPQSVALSSTTPGAVIHYTTDGSTPTADSPSYAGPIPVEKTTTVQAIVVASGAPSSAISTGTYTIAPPPPPPPARVAVTKERLELKEVVLFNTGKASIDPRSHSLLDEIAATLKNHPEVKNVRVEGHTDNTGKSAANVKLSQSRAEVVREYLVARGVANDRLTAKGYGDTQPVASNKTAAGRTANRRTDFIVTQD